MSPSIFLNTVNQAGPVNSVNFPVHLHTRNN